MEMELLYYRMVSGRSPFLDWLESLPDKGARARIQVRLDRVVVGNFGDARSVGKGVMELRLNWGAGYRIYYALSGREMILLLCGGDKSSQFEDIRRAKHYFKDYQARAKSEGQ